MSKGIAIPITADEKDFTRGVRTGMIEPLEDVEDVLKDVGRAGGKTGDELEDSMKGAQKATEKNEKANQELVDALRKSSKAGRSAGDDIKDGMKHAEEGTEEFKDEANSTAKEVAASFDGSAESIAGGFQELAANAFQGFGPAGAAAGIAAAVGLGLITTELQKQQEESDALKESFSSLYADAAEDGRTWLSSEQLLAEQHRLIWEDNGKTLEGIKEDAITAGVSWQTMLKARAGDEGALAQVIEAGTAKYEDRRKVIEEVQGVQANRAILVDKEAGQIQNVTDKLRDQQQIQKDNKEVAAAELAIQQSRESSVSATADTLARIPKTVPLTPTLDTAAAHAALDKLQRRKLTFTVGMKDQYGRGIL
jgi:hypothetical protein